jgi:hypothetical protein
MSKPPFLRVVGKDAEPDDGNDEATIAKVTPAIPVAAMTMMLNTARDAYAARERRKLN